MSNPRVMMWMNYRRGPSLAVPAPFDDNSSDIWWYDKCALLAHDLAGHGVTDVLFPNPVKGQSGAYRTGDGYNPMDDFDIGSKLQLGRVPTRFGTVEQLRRAIAICRANGINVHIDHVMHQRAGGKDGVYRYFGADGKSLNGRFPKDPGCFSPSAAGDTIPPYVHVDPVPDQADNFAFGNPLAPVNSIPKNYVWDGLLEAGDWVFRTLGVQGARLDDMKGLNVGFINTFMAHGAMNGKFFFGEYASGNPDDLNWYIGQTNGTMSLADFGFHYNRAETMCNDAGGSGFWMESLGNRNNALIGTNPMKAVPFVESMDSDTDGFATIVSNKTLGYALLLAGEGLPCIYIRDYLQEPDCYGLKSYIDNLLWCHQALANGPMVTRHSEDKIFVFERTGDPGLICALSNDVWNPAWHTVTVQTHFGAHVRLHDYTGRNSDDCWTDASGKATFGIPPGANGFGYGIWSRAGLGQTLNVGHENCTQEFFGAVDLDTPQALNGSQTLTLIWVEAGRPIESSFTPETDNWTSASRINFLITDPNGALINSGANTIRDKTVSTGGQATATGWHTLGLMSSGLPDVGSPWVWKVTYTAPQTITKDKL